MMDKHAHTCMLAKHWKPHPADFGLANLTEGEEGRNLHHDIVCEA